MSGLLKFIINIFRIAQHMVPEDYELSICLTDKNNIVVYQETKLLENYGQEDVDWIIDKIKNFANEDEKGDVDWIIDKIKNFANEDEKGDCREVVCLNEN